MHQAIESTETSSGRYAWIDIAKGYGIVLVVVGHTLRGLGAAQIISSSPLTRFVDEWIYAFHMPLFFLISGGLLSRSVSKPWKVFIADKVKTILYPYLIWSTITLAVKGIVGPLANSPNSLSDFPLLMYAPIAQYWFLYVLFILLITFYALHALGVGSSAIMIGSLVWAASVYTFPNFYSVWTLMFFIAPMAPFVPLGFLLARHYGLQAPDFPNAKWLVLTASVGFLLAAGASLNSQVSEWYGLKFIYAVAGISGVLAVSILTQTRKFGEFIQLLGRFSLEIFVLHTMASAATRVALTKGLGVTDGAAHLALGVLMGVALPIAVALIFKRIGFRYAFTWPDGAREQLAASASFRN